MDWECEVKLEKLENMIIVYEQEIKKLELEKSDLKAEVEFLKEQLEYKTYGQPKEDRGAV
jgi:cell division protein FtsB